MKKILVAYDGGEPARRACATAIELAHKFAVPVAVISVVPFQGPGQGEDAIGLPLDIEVHEKELVEARALFHEAGIEVELIEPLGDPAGAIEAAAQRGGFDTIVVGSRHLNWIERSIGGSVSEHVAVNADATVVIVR